MTEIYVQSTGTALPGYPITNKMLGHRLEMNDNWVQWVDTFIGTRSRHLAIDLETGQIRESLADLGVTAARQALDAAGLAASDIDLLIMATATPDRLMPATVNIVADRIGIDNVPTYQLQSGCSGAFQAISLGYHLLQTGAYRTALVLGGDTAAKFFDVSVDLARLPPEEVVNYVLFGDGAGAAILSTIPQPEAILLRRVVVRLTGANRKPGQVLEWFGPVDRDTDVPPAVEDYKAIESSVPAMTADMCEEILRSMDWQHSAVDYVMLPQLSVRMTSKISTHLQLSPAQEINCVGEIGNNGNAMPFFQLKRAVDLASPGSRIVGISIESSKWIKAGMALERLA